MSAAPDRYRNRVPVRALHAPSGPAVRPDRCADVRSRSGDSRHCGNRGYWRSASRPGARRFRAADRAGACPSSPRRARCASARRRASAPDDDRYRAPRTRCPPCVRRPADPCPAHAPHRQHRHGRPRRPARPAGSPARAPLAAHGRFARAPAARSRRPDAFRSAIRASFRRAPRRWKDPRLPAH